ncbi:protocadherin [Lacunimicrobium album]
MKRFLLTVTLAAGSFCVGNNSLCLGRGFGGGGGMGGGGMGGFHGGGGGGGGFGGGMGGGGGFHAPSGGMGGGGFGGGGMGGGGMGGGGGFSGGGMGGGGMSGGMGGAGNFRGGGEGGAGGFGGGGLGGNGMGQGDRGLGGNSFGGGMGGAGGGIGGFDHSRDGAGMGAGLGGGGGMQDSFGDRFGGQTPSRSSLNSFLGMPSDEGMHNLGGTQSWSNGNYDVNHGSYTGPRGGEAAGSTVSGPNGNTVGRGAAVGPNGGAVAGRGFEGADGARGGQAIGVGPDGRVAGGSAVRGPDGYGAARGFVAGPNGVAGGFTRVTPSGRYSCAAAVRTNYNSWGVYSAGWYRNYPGAWYAAGWAAGYAWAPCTWGSFAAYCDYPISQPVYYDYGNNVTYQDNSVYVNGQNVGTTDQYYQQASDIAAAGAQASASPDADWMPLGVFALSAVDQPSANISVQLAVNHDGVIRGNYTDTTTNKTSVVQGSVDKQTQRAAFTVGDDQSTVYETGVYNLTKDEAPVLIHYGKDGTQQAMLVRLKKSDDTQSQN